ncbi:MAG: hypothetical protein ACOCTG_00560 [Bacteroidota bacterium]
MIDIENGYLATYPAASFTFSRVDGLPSELHTLWMQMAAGEHREALSESRRLLREKTVRGRPLAALMAAAGAAELRCGNAAEGVVLAKRSLAILPDQWLAHAVRIAAYLAQQASGRAYRYAMTLQGCETVEAWDEPPSATDTQITLASLAWRVGAWEDVAESLDRAFPAGVASMPPPLQTDWFRLAFYRDQPDDAAAAARALLPACTIEQLDTILNAMVQHGWTAEALPLYRQAFTRNTASQLLRRRLVGLCVREGEVEEARQLAASGALNILV